MFHRLSLLARWRLWGVGSWCRGQASVVVSRLLSVLCGPMQVGVLLEHDDWHAVLHEPGWWGHASAAAGSEAHGLEAAQYRTWSSSAWPGLLNAHLGLVAGSDMSRASDMPEARDLWREAFQVLQDRLPPGDCHLTLAWPDDQLWASTVTLTGPLSATEVPALLEQELAMVLPVPIEQVAWAAQPVGQSGHAPSALGGWRVWLAWLGVGRATATQEHGDHDMAWQCWAMPLGLAHQISAAGRQLGWARLSIEPRSVSVQRAMARLQARPDTTTPTLSTRWATPPEVLAAWGAALRRRQDVSDLLRAQPGGWWWRGWPWARAWWPGLLMWGLAAGAGYMLGGVQQHRWAQEHQDWTHRLRELHATEQARQTLRQAEQQARQRQHERDEQAAYNQRFAQLMSAWASTVPEGVRWRQLSLRPQFIELQGQAVSTESFTRWMDQWPQVLPTGGQHQLQWQPEPASVQQVHAPPLLGVHVQMSWNPTSKVRE